ncbi:pilus assembly protein [Ideonella azotifigens]|uniref:Membrane protein n=1 Tax=Ideonella azotifigens TaxID=513160 RepID=A0ABN1JPA0_9BURK|nr:pilus assembly protein [Ideonella azotifigens]MCD2340020.1 pilus assembly protein [Ideonella azotifigens]
MKLFANNSLRRSRGQGMTEYIIIVALIAVAAIGVYNLFGATVRNQTAGMAAALGGAGTESQDANKLGVSNGQESTNEAKKTKGLENFTDGATVKPKT